MGNFIRKCLGLLGQFLLNEPLAPIPLSWGIMTTNIGKLPPAIVRSNLRMLALVNILSTMSPPPSD